jgi:Na+-driven multidrug efflux pump
VAFPLLAQQVIACMGYIVFAAMINALGEIPTAAHTVANTVESAFYIPGYGMQNAAAALSGAAVGARDRDRLRALGSTIRTVEVSLMVVSGALLFAFAPQMARLFTRSEEVVALGSTVLRMVAVSEPFFGVSIVTEGLLQGAGETRVPMLFNLTGMWGVRIVGTFICTRLLGMGLVAAWACMIAHNLLVFLLYVIYTRRGRLDALAA